MAGVQLCSETLSELFEAPLEITLISAESFQRLLSKPFELVSLGSEESVDYVSIGAGVVGIEPLFELFQESSFQRLEVVIETLGERTHLRLHEVHIRSCLHPAQH